MDNDLKEKIKHTTFFHADMAAFYVSLFPQLDMTGVEEDEFLGQIDEDTIFDDYCKVLIEKYGEDDLNHILNTLDEFFENATVAFEVVPAELDSWLASRTNSIH